MNFETQLFTLFVALIAIVLAVVALWWAKNLQETVERNYAYRDRESLRISDVHRNISKKHDQLLKTLGLVEAPIEQPRYVKDAK